MRIEVSFPDGEKRIHHTANKHGAAVITTSFGTFHLDGGGVYRWLGCRSITARFVSECEARQKTPPHPPGVKESFSYRKNGVT